MVAVVLLDIKSPFIAPSRTCFDQLYQALNLIIIYDGDVILVFIAANSLACRKFVFE